MIGDCKDRTLAQEGRRRIEWAAGQMPVLRQIMEDWERRASLERIADRRVPPRDDRDGQFDADAQSRRSRGRLVCVQPLEHAG